MEEERRIRSLDRERWLLGRLRNGSLGGTNLDSENLITVQTCICVVHRGTLERGATKIKVNKLVKLFTNSILLNLQTNETQALKTLTFSSRNCPLSFRKYIFSLTQTSI